MNTSLTNEPINTTKEYDALWNLEVCLSDIHAAAAAVDILGVALGSDEGYSEEAAILTCYAAYKNIEQLVNKAEHIVVNLRKTEQNNEYRG